MADQKTSALPEITSTIGSDLLFVTRTGDPPGTKNKKLQVANLSVNLNTQKDIFTATASQTIFNLTHSPSGDSALSFFRNGISTTTYNVVGSVLTWTGPALSNGETMIAWYNFNAPAPVIKPLVLARVSANIPDVTGLSASYTIVFNDEIEDVLGNYDNATGIFTADRDGIYDFSTTVRLGNLGVANNRLLGLLNATGQLRYIGEGNPGASRDPVTNIYTYGKSHKIKMSASDTAIISTQVFGGASDTVSVLANSALSVYLTESI